MDIGSPINVRHITHVTFDRLQGFLGLPIEFELEVPRRVPSASASAFGVSAESMQCSYDAYGNSVPTILLLLQERLYGQDGLKTEGIFRINPDNGKEEHLRDQINKGIVPHDIDPHCLAGLIKAWFRELPKGVLDSLSPEQVMQCHTEDQCIAAVKALPPTQAALFDWALNLMTDVVQEEECNKMNARNVAVVFAPNMTQMLDPLMALKHAVQVMNLLKTLILKTLRDRERSVIPTSLVAWNELPLGVVKKQHENKTLVVGTHTAKGGAITEKSSSKDAIRRGEAVHNKSKAGETRSLTKASAITEIVEETGSASGSEWSSSTYSSRRGSRDEDEPALADEGRLSDRLIWGNGNGNAYGDANVEDKLGQSQPLAYWLRMGRLPAIITKHGNGHTLNDDEEPCVDRLPTSRSARRTQFQDVHVPSHDEHGSTWCNHKPLADWLHREPSPAITFRLLKEAKISEQNEKPKIKPPAVEKPARLDCRARAAHPLSKRTQYLKNNGMV